MKIYDKHYKDLSNERLAIAFKSQFLKHIDENEPFYKHKYSNFGISKNCDGSYEVLFKHNSCYEPLREEVSVINGDGIFSLIRFILDRSKYINKKNNFDIDFWNRQNINDKYWYQEIN